ncbi:sensor histidine kinase [Nonomuraea rhodomycinica]|uniref:Sensor histidine kinase n=1 Tax=Nonomuraea rhodomycinica TaxID=1712872 RepID=A0A7Y6MBB6_9ACTN|nr:histidine kinase [Nonomuraea rhodomycinica]NUW41522.1 sensor histidine kinase [Nonomuraea rhodomycinica]
MGEIARARRLCWWMLTSFLGLLWGGMALSALAEAGRGALPWQLQAVPVAAAAGFTALYPRLVNAVIESRYPVRQFVTTGVLAVVVAATGGAQPFGAGLALVVWLAVAAVGVPRRRAFALGAGTTLLGVALSVAAAMSGWWHLMDVPDARGPVWLAAVTAGNAIMYVLMCLATVVSNRLWMWIYRLAVRAHEGREAHARLAVAEERLRFARDLHDLVGHRLSAIAVKTALAVRLSEGDPRAARDEMTSVNGLTRTALRELREAVRGYRRLDLGAELASVRGVLEAAGVRCELRLPYREMPEEVAPVFAYAVREAVTNVLKHSAATFCAITLSFTAERAELEVRNDGAPARDPAGERGGDTGNGLDGMRERMAAVGGDVTVRHGTDGQFLVKAVVSLPIPG